jgi:hypothetical protein
MASISAASFGILVQEYQPIDGKQEYKRAVQELPGRYLAGFLGIH